MLTSPHTATAMLGVAVLGLAGLGCSSKDDQKTMDPTALGMTDQETAFYQDGNTTIYEVKVAVPLPILRPSDTELAGLKAYKPVPYDRQPFITKNDVKIQVSWTLSNLDAIPHDVEILVDPWNEFVRYWPSFNVGEERTLPDYSGIDIMVSAPARDRISGVFTYDDMDELAIDLATVENLIDVVGPTMPPADTGGDMYNNSGVNALVNHAFDVHNRSTDNDLMSKPYIPASIAGLVGFDLGLRTYAQDNIAIEIVVELVDVQGTHVEPDLHVCPTTSPACPVATTIAMPKRAISAPPAAGTKGP